MHNNVLTCSPYRVVIPPLGSSFGRDPTDDFLPIFVDLLRDVLEPDLVSRACCVSSGDEDRARMITAGMPGLGGGVGDGLGDGLVSGDSSRSLALAGVIARGMEVEIELPCVEGPGTLSASLLMRRTSRLFCLMRSSLDGCQSYA